MEENEPDQILESQTPSSVTESEEELNTHREELSKIEYENILDNDSSILENNSPQLKQNVSPKGKRPQTGMTRSQFKEKLREL